YEVDIGRPAQFASCFRSVAFQKIDFRRPEVPRIYLNVFSPVDAGVLGRDFEKVANTVAATRRHHEIFGFGLLQNGPHRANVIACMAPVAAGVEIPQVKLVLKAQPDSAEGARNLPRDERLTAARRFMVEKDPISD